MMWRAGLQRPVPGGRYVHSSANAAPIQRRSKQGEALESENMRSHAQGLNWV